MEQERLRAKTVGYRDPINESYEATNQMYHKVSLELCVDAQQAAGISCASVEFPSLLRFFFDVSKTCNSITLFETK